MVHMAATVQRYALEASLLQAIAKGDVTDALSVTWQFMVIVYAPRINSMNTDRKASLYSTNTLLRLGAGRCNVPPVSIHELSSQFVKLISNTSSLSHLTKLHEKMVRESSLPVANKARNQYSHFDSDTLH